MSTYTATTKVTGGTLALDAFNRLAAASTLDLDFSSLTFGCLGPVAAGAKLNVIDYALFGSTGFAFRFGGDLTSNSSFQSLISDTLIDNLAAAYSFDGTYADVFAGTPEPGTISLLALGIVILFWKCRCSRAAR